MSQFLSAAENNAVGAYASFICSVQCSLCIDVFFFFLKGEGMRTSNLKIRTGLVSFKLYNPFKAVRPVFGAEFLKRSW